MIVSEIKKKFSGRTLAVWVSSSDGRSGFYVEALKGAAYNGIHLMPNDLDFNVRVVQNLDQDVVYVGGPKVNLASQS